MTLKDRNTPKKSDLSREHETWVKEFHQLVDRIEKELFRLGYYSDESLYQYIDFDNIKQTRFNFGFLYNKFLLEKKKINIERFSMGFSEEAIHSELFRRLRKHREDLFVLMEL